MSVEPSRDCPICQRLHDFIAEWRLKEPSWHNAPVPTFLPVGGIDSVQLLIVGLAPGVRGANRTGRPFTGDYAGDLLYSTLSEYGFSRGTFAARPDDGLELVNASITNAVRCVPPENKPVGGEISNCRRFLTPTMEQFTNLRAIVTLGTIAHQSTVRAFGRPVAKFPFSHGGQNDVGSIRIFSSYHCSRYNTNTGRLTTPMFKSVFAEVRRYIDDIAR